MELRNHLKGANRGVFDIAYVSFKPADAPTAAPAGEYKLAYKVGTGLILIDDAGVESGLGGGGGGVAWGAITGTLASQTDLASALALKAAMASPSLTGVPTAPTAPTNTNTTQLATTAFVQAVVAALVNSAPGVLDTLGEIAAALGDDANFAATMTTALAGKLSKSANLSDLTSVPAAQASLGGGATGIAVWGAANQGAFDAAVGVTAIGAALLRAVAAGAVRFLRQNADGTLSWLDASTMRGAIGAGTGNGDASTSGTLAQFASTTSAQLAAIISDETGSGGALVFAESPALTGVPTAPTAATNTNTTQLATTAFVRAEVAALVASAPGVLDTLGELASALGGDPDFAATVATALGNRVRFDAAQSLDGTQQAQARDNIGAGTSSFDGAYGSLSGIPSTFAPGTFTGNVNAASFKITELGAPDDDNDAVRRIWVTDQLLAFVAKDGESGGITIHGGLNAGESLILKGTAHPTPGPVIVDSRLYLKKTAYYDLVDDGNTGAAKTLDWGAGNIHKATLTANCTFTFTAPPGPAQLTLKLSDNATGGHTMTWPASVKWTDGAPPAATASKFRVFVFLFDGTDYIGQFTSEVSV